MRYLLSASCVIATIVCSATASSAQSAIVDLSEPQTGKSQFVLNADLTPADLGAAPEAPKPVPVAAVSRVPACGEGCKLEQPDVPKESGWGGSLVMPGYSPLDQERARAYVTKNALKIHNATKDERRKFRRRR
jgi:hypothetical protein